MLLDKADKCIDCAAEKCTGALGEVAIGVIQRIDFAHIQFRLLYNGRIDEDERLAQMMVCPKASDCFRTVKLATVERYSGATYDAYLW